MRVTALILAAAAGVAVLVLALAGGAQQPHQTRRLEQPNTARLREPARRDRLGDMPPHGEGEGSSASHPKVPLTTWDPSPLELPGWGTFHVQIVDLNEDAPADEAKPRRMRLIIPSPSPHFALRVAVPVEANGLSARTRDAFLSLVDVSLVVGDDVFPAAIAAAPEQELFALQPSSEETATTPMNVYVVPFDIGALASWQADGGEARGNIVARPQGTSGFDNIVWREVRLQNRLAKPFIEPGGGPNRRSGLPEDSEYATATVRLYGVPGLRTASFRLYSGGKVLPTSAVETWMIIDGKRVSIPTTERLNDAQLWLVARAHRRWWADAQQQGLTVVYEIVDDTGQKRAFTWTPELG